MSLNIDLIRSDHLDLFLLDAKSLQFSLDEDSEALARIINADIHPDWFKKKELIALRYQQIIRTPEYQPWSLRAIILRKERKMIGHIGFHTQPGATYLRSFAANGIEYGFTIFPDFRRNGYATEASVALMTWACKQHIAQGLSNQEITRKLFVALSTVKGHNLRIFAKLQAKNRTEAVARARELGLL